MGMLQCSCRNETVFVFRIWSHSISFVLQSVAAVCCSSLLQQPVAGGVAPQFIFQHQSIDVCTCEYIHVCVRARACVCVCTCVCAQALRACLSLCFPHLYAYMSDEQTHTLLQIHTHTHTLHARWQPILPTIQNATISTT